MRWGAVSRLGGGLGVCFCWQLTLRLFHDAIDCEMAIGWATFPFPQAISPTDDYSTRPCLLFGICGFSGEREVTESVLYLFAIGSSLCGLGLASKREHFFFPLEH